MQVQETREDCESVSDLLALKVELGLGARMLRAVLDL